MRFWDDYVLKDPDGDVYEAIIEALLASALPVKVKDRLKNFFLDPLPDPLPCGERGTEFLDPLPAPLPGGGRAPEFLAPLPCGVTADVSARLSSGRRPGALAYSRGGGFAVGRLPFSWCGVGARVCH